MAVRAVPTFLQAGSHPAEETRLMIGATLGTVTGSFAGGVGSADSGHGIVNYNDLAVTQNGTPNMSVNVAAGGAFIRGTQSANQGVYHLFNDATLNVVIAASDATNPRNDLIIAQVRDAAYSGASNDARIVVVTGTPAASPADPSLSAYPNALVLARVLVSAAVTSIVTAKITDTRTLADQAGRLPAFTSYAAKDSAIPVPTDGQGYYLNSNSALEGPYYYNGTSYKQPWNMPWGVLAVTSSTAGTAAVSAETVVQTTPSFTAVANRYYRVSFTCSYFGNTAADLFQIQIRQTNVAGTSYFVERFPIPANPYQGFASIVGYIIPSAGSQVLCATFARVTGTGTAGVTAGLHSQIIVEDMGPSGAPV